MFPPVVLAKFSPPDTSSLHNDIHFDAPAHSDWLLTRKEDTVVQRGAQQFHNCSSFNLDKIVRG